MNMQYDERLDGPLPIIDKELLLADLRRTLPDVRILNTAEQLGPYECDGMSSYRSVPLAVVLPESVAQVQALLRHCHQHDVPVVPRGAGDRLVGSSARHT